MNEAPPDDIMNGLYPHIGQLCVIFATLESHITQCAAIIYAADGGPTVEPEVPPSFGGKLNYLTKAFSSLPVLAPFAAEGLKIAEEALPVSVARNHIIHGAMTEYDAADTSIAFVKLDTHKSGKLYRLNERRFTIQELLAVGGSCIDLTGRAYTLVDRLVQALKPSDILANPVRRSAR